MKFDYSDVATFNQVLLELYRELPENLRLQGPQLSAVEVLIEVIEYLRFLKKTNSKILIKDTPITLTTATPSLTGQVNIAQATLPIGGSVTPKAGPVTATGAAVTPAPLSSLQRLIQNSAQEGPGGQRKFVQNDSNKPQTIYLPPGGKLVQVPGVGQIIQLPDHPPPKGPNYKPTVLQLQPGAKVAIAKESLLSNQTGGSVGGLQPVKTILGQRPRPLAPATSKSPVVLTSSGLTTAGPRPALPTAISGGQSLLRGQQPITIMAKDPSGVTRPITIMANPGSTTMASGPAVVPTLPVSKSTLPTKLVNGQPHAVFCHPECTCPLNDEALTIPASSMTEMFQHFENAIVPNALWSNFTAMKSYENRKYLYTSLILKLKRVDLHRLLRAVAMSPQRGNGADCGCIPLKVLDKDAAGLFEPTRGSSYSIILTLFHLFRRYDGTGLDSDAWVITSRKECKTLTTILQYSSTPFQISILPSLDDVYQPVALRKNRQVLLQAPRNLFAHLPDPAENFHPQVHQSPNHEAEEDEVEDPLENHDNNQEENGDLRNAIESSSEEPDGKQNAVMNGRCQHCLAVPESDSLNHQCMISDKESATFTCHYCGYCDNDLENIQSHVSRCRSFGVSPRDDIGLPLGHPIYPPKDRKPARPIHRRCPQCKACFVTENELEVHREDASCPSYHCPECKQTFVSKRPHCCLDYQLESSDERENISVVLLNPPLKDKTPVTCQTCQKLLAHSKVYEDHTAQEAHECELCSEEFESLCQLLTHSCDYLQVML
ncbi:hypothetical protein TCAL_00981 [Tigriopus californicus]|uniref:Uncharacterized protein n=1 Tax=Tigriopus californicus TaxID=6832 RepID=A0A553P4Z5_TIGCA|nr:hypothetical protein TCAL_00981 [Tigriopus californicus]